MPEHGLDVAACVRRVRQGDEDAAGALLEHLHPLVLRLIRSHRPKRMDEEDLVQMVFMKVFTKLDQYSGRVPLEHWVSRVAVNTCLGQIDRERVRPELRWSDLDEEQAHVLEALTAAPESFQVADTVAARELVDKLLASLNPADRLVIQLLYVEGRSVAEVRQTTGWSETLVKVRAFRARRKLKRHLETLLKENVT